MSQLLRNFNNLLHRRPLLTQSLLSGSISASGDMFTQYLTGQQQWDKLRTARFFILVSSFTVPSLNLWFRVLQRIRHPNRHIEIFRKLVVDQFVFSPIIYTGILTNLRLLEGYSLEESISKMRSNWYEIYTSSLSFLPAVQLINFYFIPINYRIILLQFVAFFWNSYLSYKTQKVDFIQ